MAWFKVDDNLDFHPKVVAAGNAPMGLWVRAGAYCASHLTDGHLPRAMLAPLGGRARDAQRLVSVGLWEATEDGWTFRNWSEFQPTKAQVEADRRATAERVRAYRERKGNGASNTVTNGVTNTVGTPAPTRPDPTRKKETTSLSRATQLPASWTPTDDHRSRAQESRLNLDQEAVKFRAHAEEKGRTAKNWNAAFTRWLINAAEYAQRDGRPTNHRPAYDPWAAGYAELEKRRKGAG